MISLRQSSLVVHGEATYFLILLKEGAAMTAMEVKSSKKYLKLSDAPQLVPARPLTAIGHAFGLTISVSNKMDLACFRIAKDSCNRRGRATSILASLLIAGSLVGCSSTKDHDPLSKVIASSELCRLLQHGKIFTGELEQPSAQAVVVCDQKIVAVGTDAQLGHVADRIETIDLGGRTVVPGINDAHVHVLPTPGIYLNTPSFAPAPGPTLSEVLALIKTEAPKHPDSSWLVVWIGAAVAEDPATTRQILDTVSPKHPVILKAWSGHGTFINSAAVSTLGWSTTEPDPFGGHLGRVAGGNELNGQVQEYAEHQLSRFLLAKQSDEQLAAIYRQFATQAVQLGFTSITDMALGLPLERQLRVLALANLPIRVRALCFPLTTTEACDAVVPEPIRDRVTRTGFKWIADGSPVERGSYLTAPYADMPDTQGILNFKQQTLTTMLAKALQGSPVENQAVIHATGDNAVDNFLGAAQQSGGAQAWNGRRLRLEHGDLVYPRHYKALKELGIIVVQNPLHLALPDTLHERFGAERSINLQPLKSLLDQGIPLAFGTDVIGTVESPWLDTFFAVTHPTTPSQAITLKQALSAYTLGSAYAENEENRKGTLAVGKLADLTVLSQNIFAVAPEALPATQSLLTMVGGKIVWRAPGI
jgi:predicted amidohydrolase YtcJ